LNAVKVLFASASDAVIAQTLEKFKGIFPELPLVVVSEFRPPDGEWIPYHIRRRWSENRALIEFRLRGRSIRLAAVILEPRTPHRRMRLMGLSLAPWRVLAFNETGQHFRLSPRNLPVMLRNLVWRTGNLVRSLKRLTSDDYRAAWLYWRARMKIGHTIDYPRASFSSVKTLPQGISVVIPSRNGRDLLAACLSRIDGADEIIVVDNGSDDGTRDFLRDYHPAVIVEEHATPLSFANAVNRGVARARFSHVCLLNNDMLVDRGFLPALRRAFKYVPNLFAATAQIFLPGGQRREETGKTVLLPELASKEFPVRCPEPVSTEDHTWVLYGSGGCTLYDTAKLRALRGFDQAYETAYVEDLDIGVRAWQRGWRTVYCREARVLHRHRTTTSRYFTEEELNRILERNFLRFVARVVPRLWPDNLKRLRLKRDMDSLQFAASLQVFRPMYRDSFLRAVSGEIAVFPGKAASGKPVVLIASPYVPFPLSHGAAVRMYNLMRRAAEHMDQVLVSFVDELAAVPPELAQICVEVVTVRRGGNHALPSTPRPDTVEEFDSPAFHEALRQTIAKWRPSIAQLEFTQMAQYAPDCAPARTILVEHDITYDLYAQMLAIGEDWENRRQYRRWLRFERSAWKTVDRVVAMSDSDGAQIPTSVVIPNGVDLDRFRPTGSAPDPRRLLFIGSFAHQPNVLALEFFLTEVYPLLAGVTLHVIAGQRHEQFWDLHHPGLEVDGFVADVRPAYDRAAVVIAPLIASAGTNIKIMEAMAMGKAIVSTTAGIHGLDLKNGTDLLVANGSEETAEAILRLLALPHERVVLERQARRTAELRYGWDAIAEQQKMLYTDLLN
jgi:GT2 family glycosyltransferase